jgi:hypothetical protein
MNDPAAHDNRGRRYAATLAPDLVPSERIELCEAAIGHHVRIDFRYKLAGRSSMTGTVTALATNVGNSQSRPVFVLVADGETYAISLAAVASWARS